MLLRCANLLYPFDSLEVLTQKLVGSPQASSSLIDEAVVIVEIGLGCRDGIGGQYVR